MIQGKKLDLNIRTNMKNFFLEQLLAKCPNRTENGVRKNSLLIIDNHTAKIIDSFVGMMDLIENGILGIERLDCARKKFRSFHIIYFIEPSKSSVKALINDFLEERPLKKDPAGNPMSQEKGALYDFCHIIFSSKVSEELLKEISQHKNLVYAMLSIRQVNMDVFAYDENLFSLNLENEKELQIANKASQNISEKILNQFQGTMMSVFTLLKNIEFVQFVYEKEGFAKVLGEAMVQPTKVMINEICRTKITKNIYPPVFFVIVNRSLDLLSPLLQSDTYGGQFYDILRNQEPILQYEKELDDDKKIKMRSKLNDEDLIWQNFKYKEYEKATEIIMENFQKFYQKQQETQAKGDLDALRNMPEFQEIMDQYTKHLNTLNKIKEKREALNFEEIFQKEQSMATLKTKDGREFDFNSIDNDFLKNKEDRLRFALLGILTGKNEDQILEKILKSEDLPDFKVIKDNLKKLWPHDPSGKFEQYKLENKIPIEKQELGSQFFEPICVKLLNDLISGDLWKIDNELGQKFKRVQVVSSKTSKPDIFDDENIFPKSNGINDIKPVVIYFVIGGLAFNEAQALLNYQEEKQIQNFNLLVGGTSFHSSHSFLGKFDPNFSNYEQNSEQSVQDEKSNNDEQEIIVTTSQKNEEVKDKENQDEKEQSKNDDKKEQSKKDEKKDNSEESAEEEESDEF